VIWHAKDQEFEREKGGQMTTIAHAIAFKIGL